MLNSFIEKARLLNAGNEAYAIALVVRRRIPSSGKPGDKAIITADGQIHGWIGGGCTKGIVLKEALLALQEEKPRLISSVAQTQPHHFWKFTHCNGLSQNCRCYGLLCDCGYAPSGYF